MREIALSQKIFYCWPNTQYKAFCSSTFIEGKGCRWGKQNETSCGNNPGNESNKTVSFDLQILAKEIIAEEWKTKNNRWHKILMVITIYSLQRDFMNGTGSNASFNSISFNLLNVKQLRIWASVLMMVVSEISIDAGLEVCFALELNKKR